ncbi:hypothetical protein AB4453_20060 [Vibrio atlanticus]|uniref:hypothetical protein n=1 Tax=Vibrio atlanticus TaxID=693153 RepID=UPI00354FF2F5
MFIRFIASMEEEKRLQHTHGIITQAQMMLVDGLILDEYHQVHIKEIFTQLNESLPCPPFHSKSWPDNAISWFLDSSVKHISLMYELKYILEEYDSKVATLHYSDVGTILYRDDFQVVAKSSLL